MANVSILGGLRLDSYLARRDERSSAEGLVVEGEGQMSHTQSIANALKSDVLPIFLVKDQRYPIQATRPLISAPIVAEFSQSLLALLSLHPVIASGELSLTGLPSLHC